MWGWAGRAELAASASITSAEVVGSTCPPPAVFNLQVILKSDLNHNEKQNFQQRISWLWQR
jgi:hypothetical protein